MDFTKRIIFNILGIVFPLILFLYVIGMGIFYGYPLTNTSALTFAERWNPQNYYFGVTSLVNFFSAVGNSFTSPTQLFYNIINSSISWSLQDIDLWESQFTETISNFTKLFNGSYSNDLTIENIIFGIYNAIWFVFDIFWMVGFIIGTTFVAIGSGVASAVVWLMVHWFMLFTNIMELLKGTFNTPITPIQSYEIPSLQEWGNMFNTLVM